MNIAFLTGAFPQFSQTFILNQVVWFMERGCEVDVIALRPTVRESTFSEAAQQQAARHRLLERICYPPDLPQGRAARLWWGVRTMLRHGTSHPCRTLRALNGRRFGRDAISLALWHRALPLIEGRSYDAIICHFGYNGILGQNLRDIGVLDGNLVTVFHGFDVSSFVQTAPDAYRRLFAAGDLFLPISEHWRQKLVALGCDRRRMVVHHMGVDTARLPFASRVPRPQQPVRLVSVARLVEKKGLEYAVRALARISGRFEFHYTIIGDGPLRSRIEGLVRDLGLEGRITITGALSHDEALKRLSASDILLAPSVTAANGDQEGIPVVLMEAMALGLPVVSTAHSGIPELVDHGISGLLVPERDDAALAGALSELLQCPERWPALAAAARRKVESEFDANKLNERLFALLGSGMQARVAVERLRPRSPS